MKARRWPILRLCALYLSQRLTPAGRALFLIWLMAALQGSISLDIPIYHIWSFTTVCFALAWLTSYMAVPDIHLMRRQPPAITAGAPLTYEVEIENRSRRAAYALSVMKTHIPAGLQRMGAASSPVINRLAPHAKMILKLQLNSMQRGHHPLSALHAASSYPLGLLRGISFHAQDTCATVYPAYAALASFQLPRQSTLHNADRGAASPYAMAETSPDFAYVREYRQGDNPRHLHWASWARTGIPATKVYQEETGLSVGLILDTAAPSTHSVAALESGISAVAGIAAYLLREGIEVDAFATANLLCPLSYDTPGKRFAHLMHTLAGLQASASVAWPSIATRLMQQAPRCNTIVLIALDWSQDIAAFVDRLQHHGLGVRTLVIRHGPTSQPLPPTAPPTLLAPGDPWPQEAPLLPWRGP